MPGQELRYQADGLTMIGSLHRPSGGGGKRPGVVIFPEAFGLGEHAMEKAERVANELGYVCLAADLHGERKNMTSLEEVMPALQALSSAPARLRERAANAAKALASQDGVDGSRLAAMGYCFGGTMSFELATSGADIKAAIGFHSGLGVPSLADAKNIKGKVMALLGAEDPLIPLEQREAFATAMTAAGVDWQMTRYGGVVHSFTNPAADANNMLTHFKYDALADKRSWKQMSDLLAEVFA
jgi:dienelactone hydrolase